jgi:hypothetical protein
MSNKVKRYLLIAVACLAVFGSQLACNTEGVCDANYGNNCDVNSGETFGRNGPDWLQSARDFNNSFKGDDSK